jgi:hypothetical protein
MLKFNLNLNKESEICVWLLGKWRKVKKKVKIWDLLSLVYQKKNQLFLVSVQLSCEILIFFEQS